MIIDILIEHAFARGVQPPGGITDQLLQPRFHVHVDVLERGLELELALVDLLADARQAVGDGVAVRLRQNALLHQHGGMGERTFDIFLVEALVDVDRGVYLLHDRSRAGGKAAAPHLAGAGCRILLAGRFGGFLVHRVQICPRLPPTCDGRARPGQADADRR